MDEPRYRWLKVSLVLGGLLALLLLVNSVVSYVFISRRIVVEQLRREMGKHVVALERQFRQAPLKDNAHLAVLIEELRKDHKIAWIDVRDRQGRQLTHAGLRAAASFSAAQIHTGLANHEPITTVRGTDAGQMVVEIFPFHLPPDPRTQGPGFGVVEMAMSLDSESASVWPLRKNLIIDCSAALALFLSLVVIALRFRSYLKGKQLEQQVEIARQVQLDLLPAPNQKLPHVEYAAECIPAWGVGGDFHDIFAVDGNGLALVLGDVSGKGMPAALLMGVIHGAVRSSSWAESAWRHEDCSRKLNHLLCERASGARYASMFWSYYNADSGNLHYINAGHCPPLLVQTRGGRTAIRRLEEGGPVLGLLTGARYEQSMEVLAEGDLLVLYSDGVVEASNGAGEEFGEDRLIEVLERYSILSADEIRYEITAAVQDFISPAKAHDDVSLVAVRFGRAANSILQISNQSEVAVA